MNNVRYADDTALVADSEKKLQKLLQTVNEESKKKCFVNKCKENRVRGHQQGKRNSEM